MRGVITAREVITHYRLIWREFGFGCLVRCAGACIARKRTTFLDIVWSKRELP